jgi:hypothetical protein
MYMGSHSPLRYLALCLALLMCFVTSCTSPKLDEARDGMQAAVAELPDSPQLHHIVTTEHVWPVTEDGGTCYYARSYLVYGTQLPATEVLDWYTDRLEPLNWSLEQGRFEQDYMDVARQFTRGDHEFRAVSTGTPGFAVEQSFDYERYRQEYINIVVVSVDYVVPQSEGC